MNQNALAIIGLACRFPGAPNARAFWRLLAKSEDPIREVPRSRWNIEDYYHPEPGTPGKMNSRWGGFVEAIEFFDPQFFGLSPREAELMDPQQKLALEVAHEALQDAAIPTASLKGGNVAVFIGVQSMDHYQALLDRGVEADPYTATGNAHCVIANRLSYLLDLRGPSMAVDTACSSSLVAIHLAARSLRAGEADLAIAGGVNVLLSPELTVALSQARMMSSDGRCKTFDARADGYVRSEGCGMVILKRLADAVRDKDPIWAVVRGSAVNQDGRSNGLTAPNGPAQQAVIKRALADADVAARDISYVEAHGTGTTLGDPLEIHALAAALAADRPRPIRVGSVKTNIGHLEPASGVAGLIKVVLALDEGAIPANLHFQRANPELRLETLPLELATARTPWARAVDPRIAGVSAFGFGGTNAHVIVEEAPVLSDAARLSGAATAARDRSTHVLALSARTPELVREEAHQLAELIRAEPWIELADLAYTRNVGRDQHLHRAALVASSSEELEARLDALARGERTSGAQLGHRRARKPPKIAFLFTGQGAQAHGMGHALFEREPSFRAIVERCAALADRELERPLLSVMYPLADAQDDRAIHQTAYAQPALFAIEYALAEWWRSIGVEPAMVLGHSVGELAAAVLANSLSVEDAVHLAVVRGRLMQECGGQMAAVFAPEAAVREALEDGVSIAAFNEPEHLVISGAAAPLAKTIERLERGGHLAHRLNVSAAFHSAEMDPVLARMDDALRAIEFRAPELPWVSTLSGELMRDPPGARYWVRQVREPVQFTAGLRASAELGATVFLEIGPSKTLTQLGRHTLASDALAWIPSLDRDEETRAVAALYASGVELDFERFDRAHPRSKLRLVSLPYERQRMWFEAAADAPAREVSFSLMFSAADDREHADYRRLLDAARFADACGFSAIWIQEHHFSPLGGSHPNPSITAAAIAAVTKRIALRGSIMLPQHHPLRIAEEWAMVDKLSGGRAGIALSTPVDPNAFRFGQQGDSFVENMELIRSAWSGERSLYPRPKQAKLPLWISAGCQDERYVFAGEVGASLLIPLAASRLDEHARRIALYRESRRAHGHPGEGWVTMMMPAMIGDALETVKEIVRAPMIAQLEVGAARLMSRALAEELATDAAALRRFATATFDHHFESGGLFGTVETARARVRAFRDLGVNELALTIDYSLAAREARSLLRHLDQLHRAQGAGTSAAPGVDRLERGATYEDPTDETERILVEIWSAVLRLPRVGIHDNFFELGGDSRLAIEIIRRAAAAGITLDPLRIFEKQTIAELAAAM